MACSRQPRIPTVIRHLIRTVWAVIFVPAVFAAQLAGAQTLTVLHTFTTGSDGAGPGSLTKDAAGNFYGTTAGGGLGDGCAPGCGTAYKLVRHGSSFVFYPIYEFTYTNHGPINPAGRLVFGPDGSLYGASTNGGSCSAGWCGTVFKLQPPPFACPSAQCWWNLTMLHSFAGGDDGAFPYGDITFDRAGNIYGTTSGGGSSSCEIIKGVIGCGTVFKLSPQADGSWTNTTLYEFQGASDGGNPYAGVVLDQAGNIYGTTPYGGTGSCSNNLGCGALFQLTPSGSGWVETTLHEFSGGPDGGGPSGGLIFDNAGNLDGAAASGGLGQGTVYQLTPTQGNWTFNVLYSFRGNQASGPSAALTLDATGNLYGTSAGGGANGGFGTVFKLTLSNGKWVYSSLHDFDLGSDGGLLYSSVVLDASGNVYGTAFSGPYPSPDAGVIFEITP